jgi:hypothetical protein
MMNLKPYARHKVLLEQATTERKCPTTRRLSLAAQAGFEPTSLSWKEK